MKKILFKIFLLVILLFILLTLKNGVSAFTFTHNTVEYTVPDLPEDSESFDSKYYSILFFDNAYHILSYVGYDPSIMTIVNTNEQTSYMGIVYSDTGKSSSARMKFWTVIDDVWTLDSWQPNSGCCQYYRSRYSADKYIYSTLDIYCATGSGDNGTYTISDELFFPETLLILQPIVKEQQGEMGNLLMEMLNILPMILVVVAFYIGLRKGLIMLSEVLHRA